MVEMAIFALIASGLWVVAKQINQGKHPPLLDNSQLERRSLSLIAEGGLYRISTPTESANLRAFDHLQLIEGGLKLYDNASQQASIIDFATIQWVSAVTLPQADIAEITIHIEAQSRWHILSLQMPFSDMSTLVKILRQSVLASRLNIGRQPATPIGPLSAHVSEDTLQGESNLGAEISLYLLPHLLLVLQGDKVQAKLDTSSIRRVLSVERISNRLDNILKPNTPEGVIRLYSLYETVSFALPQFRELAEEIAYLSHCPVEFITQEDKSGKM
ncbi:MAG: hypothetical protein Phog2KO_42400 [Phototrophicaceae bacterium]